MITAPLVDVIFILRLHAIYNRSWKGASRPSSTGCVSDQGLLVLTFLIVLLIGEPCHPFVQFMLTDIMIF